MAFKMKGSPMQRNFGIGAPTKKVTSKEEEKEEELEEPTDEKKAKMAKKGLAYNPKTGGWMRVWTGDE